MLNSSELPPRQTNETQKDLHTMTEQNIEVCQAVSPKDGSACGKPAEYYYANCALCDSCATAFVNANPPPFPIPISRA